MHKLAVAFSVALLMAVPAAAQQRLEYMPPGAASDHTRQSPSAPNFGIAVPPSAGLNSVHVPPPPPVTPAPSALWTYSGLQYYTTCPGYCDAVGAATCAGSACPVSSCTYYCTYNPFSGEGCGAPGTVTTSSPSQMGFLSTWPFGTCGA